MVRVRKKSFLLGEYGGGSIICSVVAGSYEKAALAVGGTIRRGKDGKAIVFPNNPEHLTGEGSWVVFDNGFVQFDIRRGEEPKVRVNPYPVIIA